MGEASDESETGGGVKGEKVGTTVEGGRTPAVVTTEETVKEASEKSASAVGVERGPFGG